MSSSDTRVSVSFQTFGCRSNYADTVDLQSALIERGFGVGEHIDGAAIHIINTCSVTDEADREALRAIERTRRRNPEARIIVTGCLAEVGSAKLSATGAVDAVVGPGRRAELLAAITDYQATKREVSVPRSAKAARRGGGRRQSISLDHPLSSHLPGPLSGAGDGAGRARYHLRIQEGCDNFCTFCIIPLSRGSLTSRPAARILEDLTKLWGLGYGEIVLTGTHLGGWGEDIGSSLYDLLCAIEEREFPGRIRLSSIDPNDLEPRILALFARSHTFCYHLHICVQALTDDLLKRMNRRYRMKEVKDLLTNVRESLPECCIGADLITGFPGESREELDQEIQEFLELPLSYLHVFPYSERTGTSAVHLDGSVPVAERKRRAARWRALGERRYREFTESFVGRGVEAVFERMSDGFWVGTSREYLPVKIGLETLADGEIRRGAMYRALTHSYDEQDGYLLCELFDPEN
ncbi:MAG: MiaB/RimO family radical SAM methylthiotransferase [Deltaproteobacteria bacterium]|nr:MiaB/RimO family radical SAM methylthiotransferase [Deltaproteobacteria bacterium]